MNSFILGVSGTLGITGNKGSTKRHDDTDNEPFECPYGKSYDSKEECSEEFDDIEKWAEHMRSEHEVNGPI